MQRYAIEDMQARSAANRIEIEREAAEIGWALRIAALSVPLGAAAFAAATIVALFAGTR